MKTEAVMCIALTRTRPFLDATFPDGLRHLGSDVEERRGGWGLRTRVRGVGIL